MVRLAMSFGIGRVCLVVEIEHGYLMVLVAARKDVERVAIRALPQLVEEFIASGKIPVVALVETQAQLCSQGPHRFTTFASADGAEYDAYYDNRYDNDNNNNRHF